MGQCSSNDAKSGKLSVKKILSKTRKKNSNSKKKEDHNKIYPMAEGGRKNQKTVTSKGVAMSFGFKKRPTPMTAAGAGGATAAWDPNGNKDEGKEKSSQKPTPKTRLTSCLGQQNVLRINDKNCNSPEMEQTVTIRNVKIVTTTQMIRSTCDDNKASGNRVLQQQQQQGRFTLQTTRLPQPEPIQVIETKTAKTIANNNKRSARMLRRHEEGSTAQPDGNLDVSLLDRLQTSDSLSGTFSPPPLPELPSVFDSYKVKETRDNRNRFLQSCPPGTFLKSRGLLAGLEQDWMISGGEAMADDISLDVLSPSPPMIDSLKESMHLTLSEEDPKFTAVATTSGLLDDEILSPVGSLFSSSEGGEELPNQKDDSDSKEVNERPTLTHTLSNHSLSLSDDNKEDFLIDDEIADQPELVFETARRGRSQNLAGSLESLETCESIGSEDLMLDFENEQSPFPVRRNNFLKSASVASPSGGRKSSSSQKIHFTGFGGYHSMSSETLLLTKSNHSAVQQDIISIKTMLLTLKRVLNDSETEVRLGEGNNNNNNEFTLELADLRRQVLFLQGQLEDKEKAVVSLRQQVDDMATRSTQTSLDNSKFLGAEHTSNAATQTDKQQTRPLPGMFSPVDETNATLLRFIVK